MKIIVTHAGKQLSLYTVTTLYEKGYLFKYITTIYDKTYSFTRIIRMMLLKGIYKKNYVSHKFNNLPNVIVLRIIY